MADLPEDTTYPPGVYQIEPDDPVQGGPAGIANIPTLQLANRTAWLRAYVDQIAAARGPVRVAVHDADPAASRPPGTAPVLWIGPATPANAALYDLHAQLPI